MIKINDRVYHWQRMDRIGTVVDIVSTKNNQMTVGGTTDVIVYYKIKFIDKHNPQGIIETHRSGDIQKSFD